jgi:hypothetical protein
MNGALSPQLGEGDAIAIASKALTRPPTATLAAQNAREGLWPATRRVFRLKAQHGGTLKRALPRIAAWALRRDQRAGCQIMQLLTSF